ncbi:MAG: nuclear transport factor 2 family protein [Capsulimonas sp.]|uniref:nuclear transport factor 2 family protein n=1 Tax=Capsulimonas sp. TaxID=2494211 RepID=UPI0032636FD9
MITQNNFVAMTACALALSLAFAATAQASPTRSIAREHWQAIAGGDVSSVMADYRSDAASHWKSGGLKGDYSGTATIRSAWMRFAKTRSPLKLAVRNVQETKSGKDQDIITAEVTFSSTEWTYPLDCRLIFHDGKIAEETWSQAGYDADPGSI